MKLENGLVEFHTKYANQYFPGDFIRHFDDGMWGLWKIVEVVDANTLTARIVITSFGQGEYGE